MVKIDDSQWAGHRKIGSIDPGVCPLIDGNQIQDGGCSGHLGWAAELIIERNLPLVTPMSHRKIGSIDICVCPLIDRNKIQDIGRNGHLGWAAELIIERNLPLVIRNKPQKNRINRPRRLSYNWRKPNVYRHGCIGHDILKPHSIQCSHFNSRLMTSVHSKPVQTGQYALLKTTSQRHCISNVRHDAGYGLDAVTT
jgi:hypothetical protein